MKPMAELDRRIRRIAALDQPLRRDLYRLLSVDGDWVTRDAAADALGVARSVAAFHLDKLVEAGVVDVTFQRTTGRTGPGAGRPAKLYRRAAEEVAASVPDRRYDVAGSLLATAVEEAGRTGAPVATCLTAAARTAGRALGEGATAAAGSLTRRDDRRQAVVEVLTRHGYEPRPAARGEIALVNCPFHRLAEEHRELVCGMNRDFLAGLVDGLAPGTFTARLIPEPGHCCVRLEAR